MDSVPQVWERTTREPWRDPLPLVPETGPRHGPGTQARAGDPGTGRGVPSRAEPAWDRAGWKPIGRIRRPADGLSATCTPAQVSSTPPRTRAWSPGAP